MPNVYKGVAEAARLRHKKRALQPGVTVDVEKTGPHAYRLVSPHRDEEAWIAMLCDALGTRSTDTAHTFLRQLTQLCPQYWHSDGEAGQGEWVAGEDDINMVLAMVAGIKPRNEMEAALAAQMVAVHMMMMGVSGRALQTYACADPRMAAVAAKLARTFAIQSETLVKLRGRKTSRQSIKVSHEKHVHQHQHIHVHRGGKRNGGQPHAPMDSRIVCHGNCEALPGSDAAEGLLPVPVGEGATCLPDARGQRLRSTKRS